MFGTNVGTLCSVVLLRQNLYFCGVNKWGERVIDSVYHAGRSCVTILTKVFSENYLLLNSLPLAIPDCVLCGRVMLGTNAGACDMRSAGLRTANEFCRTTCV